MPNITVRIDDEQLIRDAKVLAAQQGSSLSAMFREYLEMLVAQARDTESAKRVALNNMRQGFRLGGGRFEREDIYGDRTG